MFAAAAASASAVAYLFRRMNQNANPATAASPISTAATAIPAIVPVLSPDELCEIMTVPFAGAVPAFAVVADEAEEVEIAEDIEGDVEDDVEEKDVVGIVDAATCVPGKSLRAMA